MEDRDPCLITSDEERAIIIVTLVRELRISESEAVHIASQIQNDLNAVVIGHLGPA